MFERFAVPIVQAPMAGGPSTPALAAAVSRAGGLGMVAAGYRPADGFRDDLREARRLSAGILGVNLFAPPGPPAPAGAVACYAEAIGEDLRRAGVAPGAPRSDDDGLAAKLEVLRKDPVDVVSFTFGWPSPDVVAGVRATGAALWLTVTSADDARAA